MNKGKAEKIETQSSEVTGSYTFIDKMKRFEYDKMVKRFMQNGAIE